ncbi:MAG TPA: gamma-glutamyltransferase [Caulobacteraceae bacterium]
MRLVLFAALAVLSACARPQVEPPPAAAEAPSAMVAAANPLAVEAGLEVLRAGGNAADAAVAVQAALGLVEPQSSGLGGGGFLMYFDAATGKVTAYNGREHAPAGATPRMFLNAAGEPLPFQEAVVSGRAVGAPGAVAMLGMVHREHGRRPWASLFTGTARLAEQGFVVSPRLESMIHGTSVQAKSPDAVAYFSKPDGTRLKAGDVLRNPAYAATLRRIAADGPRALLEGPIAEAIVARVRQGPLPGSLTTADLAAYQPVRSEPLCRPWRVQVACVPPPPSSGVGLLQLLLMLEHTDIDARGPTDPQGWYLFAEASRLMYADRDRYVGDPAFVRVPVEGLLDPAYVRSRAALIGPRAGPPPMAGDPPGAGLAGVDRTLEPAGTTHFVVVDRWGNVASMTTTVESIFGSGRMVGGFFLNNQMTDFSFRPTDEQGRPAANAVAPRKRPRSSMSPVIVLDRQGRFVAAVGSPGGNSIPAYNAKAMVGVFDWKLPMQEAIALPNLVARGSVYSSEREKFAPGVVEGLAARGVDLVPGRTENSGLHGVIRRAGGRLEGGADPRREGVARAP